MKIVKLTGFSHIRLRQLALHYIPVMSCNGHFFNVKYPVLRIETGIF